MIHYYRHTFKMPNKSILQGYKFYAIADYGYIFCFMISSPLKDISELFKNPKLTPTDNMVVNLVEKLSDYL